MTINKEPVNFSPQNPCLPVGLFLSIVEHDSRGLEPKDVIKLAVSRIEKSSLKEQPVFSKLEEGITWMGFKSLMEKTFYLEPSLNDNLQLLRSLVKGKSEDTRHYLLRAQYVAGIIKKMDERDCIKLLFLTGLPAPEAEFCLQSDTSDLETMADLLALGFAGADHKEGELEQGDLKQAAQHSEDKFDQPNKIPKMIVPSATPTCSEKQEDVISIQVCNLSTSAQDQEEIEVEEMNPEKVIFADIETDLNVDITTQKPDKTYSQLICDAFKNSSSKKLSIDEICAQISKDHPFYAATNSWHSSIDFNLSLNKELFQMVDLFKGYENEKWIMLEGAEKLIEKDVKMIKLLKKEPKPGINSDTKNIENTPKPPSTAKTKRSQTKKKEIKNLKTGKLLPSTMNPKPKETKKPKRVMMPTGNGEKIYACQHDGCSFKAEKFFMVTRHIKRTHDKHEMPLLKCPYNTISTKCPYQTRSYANLRRHLQSHLPALERILYGCMICPAVKTQKNHLKIHMREKHDIQELVEFRSVKAKDLDEEPSQLRKMHVNNESKEVLKKEKASKPNPQRNPTPCPVCGMVITLTYRLKHHIKQIHEKESHTYFCAQCSFSTYARSLLDKHVSSLHTLPVEERKTHMCDQCGAKFVDKTKLKSHHQAVHLDIKRYRCTICDIRYASGGNLKEHIGLKHMGISSKDWRNPEFKAVRDSASSHQAWEFVPAAGDPFRYNRQT